MAGCVYFKKEPVTCHRRREDVGRLSAKRPGVTHSLRQSPDRHVTRRGANACQPFMKGLKRLRKAAFWPTAQVSVQISRELLARQLVKLLRGTKPADLPPNSLGDLCVHDRSLRSAGM